MGTQIDAPLGPLKPSAHEAGPAAVAWWPSWIVDAIGADLEVEQHPTAG